MTPQATPGRPEAIEAGGGVGRASDRRSRLVACLGPAPTGADLTRLGPAAGWLRVDGGAGPVPAGWLRDRFAGRLLYALGDDDRGARLGAAARDFDLVELDAGRDLTPDVLAAVPAERRLVSWRGPAEDAAALAARLRRLSAVPARFYRLAVEADRVRDALPPLELLAASRRPDVVAYALGEAGLWGRVLSAALGAPLVFGAADDVGATSGEPALARLVDDFGLDEVSDVRQVYGIVGAEAAVRCSLSPRLHNAAYRACGLPALFVPLPAEDLQGLWGDLVESRAMEALGLPLLGLTVASPHKESAVRLARSAGAVSRRAGSANLLRRGRGHRAWQAETTDPDGVTENLRRHGVDPAGRRAAVVGCGGSGRAIAAALDEAGARVVLCNRGRARGEDASTRLGLPFVPLAAFDPAEFDLVVNATTVGPAADDPPFRAERLAPGTVVVDLVYTRGRTPLVAAARARGAVVIDGREVLLVQASRQFARMTGRAIPPRLAAGLLGLEGPPGCETPGPSRSPLGGTLPPARVGTQGRA